MFYTGVKRDARDILRVQADATIRNEKEIVDNLNRVKEIGRKIRKALEDVI